MIIAKKSGRYLASTIVATFHDQPEGKEGRKGGEGVGKAVGDCRGWVTQPCRT